MLFDHLFQHAAEIPNHPAVIDATGEYTYKSLASMAAGLGMYIGARTSRPNVGLFLPPSAAFVAAFYGTLLAGKTVVPINYLLGERETAHVIKDSGVDTILSVPPLAAKLKDAEAAGVKVIDLTQLPPAPPAGVPVFPSLGEDDLAVLMYTSGTSGLPKGVMLSYGNLDSDANAAIAQARMQTRHTFLGIIPLFHSFGLTAMMLCPIQLGAPVIYLPRFTPMGTLETIRKHKPSIFFGVPAMFAALLRLHSAKPDEFASFFAMISGGEALPAPVREGFQQRFGVTILEGYGLTETSPVVHINVPHAAKAGFVGTAVPGCQTRIADDNGNALPANQQGEVWVKGPMIMKGYYNLPQETAKVMTPDGFFKTGDLGHLDEEGYLFITGRKKDLIISAGEKVAPREVEETLGRHPEVAEAAVVGRKDPTRGEAVVAFVVLTKGGTVTGEALRSFCRDQGLVSFKIPKDVYVVADLPRNPTGKVMKRELAVKAEKLNANASDEAPPRTQ